MTTPRKRKMRRRNWKEWDRNTAKLGNDELAIIRMSREPEPRMVRWNRFEIVVVDRLTGERGSFELRSLRDAVKRLAVMMKFYD